MKIAVFGATGKTGRLVLDGLLSQGHVITALVRTPARIDIQHPNLYVQQGDALVAEDVTKSVRATPGVDECNPDPSRHSHANEHQQKGRPDETRSTVSRCRH